MNYLFKNVDIVLFNRVLKNGWLKTENQIINSFGDASSFPEVTNLENCEVINGEGNYLCPGFVDTHVHGGGGGDFRDETKEAYLIALKTHLKGGTTTIVPTLSSATKESILANIRLFNNLKSEEDKYNDIPNLAGLHLEGPYFSQEQRGAQNESLIRNPDPEEYNEILEATPYIKRWANACELPGALEFGKLLCSKGICASVGHSNATTEQVVNAVENYGYSCITHIYSGCSSLHRNGPYREGGVVEAGFLLKDLDVEVIGDGKHLPPLFLKLIYQIKGVDRISLVTDCLRPGGVPYAEGQIVYDDKNKMREIILENGVAIMPDRKNFAGSISTMSNLVRVMVNQVGIPITDVVRMASYNPARMLSLENRIGSISAGKDADLLLLGKNFEINKVMKRGRFPTTF